MAAQTTDGDQVAVRAAIEMGTFDANVVAEVVVNGKQFPAREWRLS